VSQPLCLAFVQVDRRFLVRIQMDVDSRKNEVRADFKQQDIRVEVMASIVPLFALIYWSAGIAKQGYCKY
jgi:hypothetical protein